MRLKALLVSASFLAIVTGAQAFVDGGFDTGNLNAWTITPTTNGATNFQDVFVVDIDGGGPLGANNAGRFSVGQQSFQAGVPAGIRLTQSINLVSGQQYTLSFNWSAQRNTSGNNAQGGIFDLIVNGTSIAHGEAGDTSSTNPKFGFLTANYTATSTGAHTIGAMITRPFTIPADLYQYVDNFSIVPEPTSMVALGAGLLAIARRRRK